MFITIIRIIFWALVFTEIMLLIFSSKIKCRISVAYTDCSFMVKTIFVVCYAYFTLPKISFHTDWFLRLIGFIFVILLLFIVRRTYLPKAIRRNKVYQMTNLHFAAPEKDNDNYLVFGDISESDFVFNVFLTLEPEIFMSLQAQGYFDLRAQNKSLSVKLLKTDVASPSNNYADATVQLA